MPTTTRPTVRLAPRVQRIEPSPTLAVLQRATELVSQGIDVVDLGAGEPDFPTPDFVCRAAIRAIDEGYTKYTHNHGSKQLRDAISARYNRRYGTTLGAHHVITGTGGKQELFNVSMALVSDGDEVIIPGPYWVSFPDQVVLAGGTPVIAMTTEANQFRPTLETIESAATSRTRGVILNSPCNPTGAVIDDAELAKIVEFCHARGLFLLFDETYEFFVYDGIPHASAIRYFERFPETVIVVSSMSKTFSMTGWRLGYAVAAPEIVATLGKIQSHSTSNPSSIAQRAAIEALSGGENEIRMMWEAYAERRAWLVPSLNDISGIHCLFPDGAFYVFPRVSELYGHGPVRDSITFSDYLIEEARVSVVPGSAFGADDYIRISYATSLDRLREGVSRIANAAAELSSRGSRAGNASTSRPVL